MARKHAKKFSKKQPVERVLVGTNERRIVQRSDGSIEFVGTSPKYQQGKAQGPTSTYGKRNAPPAKSGAVKK